MAIPWYSDSLPLRTHCGGVWVSIGEEEGERGTYGPVSFLFAKIESSGVGQEGSRDDKSSESEPRYDVELGLSHAASISSRQREGRGRDVLGSRCSCRGW
jgi:hypothetical protein